MAAWVGAGATRRPGERESHGWRSERAGGVTPGTPGPGATVRGPAAPVPDGVSRGFARHVGATPRAGLVTLLAVGAVACGTAVPAGARRVAVSPAPTSTAPTTGARREPVTAPRETPARDVSVTEGSAVPTGSRAATPSVDPPLPSGLPSSAPLRVTLGSACVVPGTEQRLVVETVPDAFVAYDNLYPDSRTGQAYGGAEGSARSDTRGRFTAVWRVAPHAPYGRVRVDVGVSARTGSAITMTYYRLAAAC